MRRRASQETLVELRFWVKQTHLDALQTALDRVSNPNSPDYGHYLSKAQVDALTAPTRQDVATVEEALHGVAVHKSSDGALISAEVSVGVAERILGGTFVYFCHSGGDSSCVLRNPSAQVPQALQAACDFISPLEDPLPPAHPGPIILGPLSSHGDGLLDQHDARAIQPASVSQFSDIHAPEDTTIASGRLLVGAGVVVGSLLVGAWALCPRRSRNDGTPLLQVAE